MVSSVKFFTPEGTEPDAAAVTQLLTCMEDERAVEGALMADHHRGYSMPIGGVIAYEGAVSPSGVGYDIACGNKAVRTDLSVGDLVDLAGAMTEISLRVSFGMGRSNPDPVDHPVFEHNHATFAALDRMGKPNRLIQKARAQLGTVGGGNHYVDLLADEDGRVWVAVHFGSRGFGHTVATGFLNMAAGKPFDAKGKDSETPTVIPEDSDLGQFYIEAMHTAGEYAYAGRDYVVDQVLQILGNPTVTEAVHNHHNFAWFEDGRWVVRKGATPLTDEDAFIGGSMGDWSVIVRGRPHHLDPDAMPVIDIGAIGSAPHGAGRVMSRTKAAGKFKRKTVYECNERDCSFTCTPQEYENGAHCPDHPARDARRISREERKSDGVVDWDAVRAKLSEGGIELRGAGADEAPEVYKRLMPVLDAHPNIEIVHQLWPLGVVMAGPDISDPYRD